ncbi:PQQ-binding-like beta-propeller repeat protein [Candidatus Uabimicrobium sp. HlEnr_7]|uniref:protein kinase domain-containing protein n=1 Tax=Candidatus Uabimicrobium helgolandensis TaxID=3095367 RepID=UPI0035570532
MTLPLKNYFFHLLRINKIDTAPIQTIWNQKCSNKEDAENLKWLINHCIEKSYVNQSILDSVLRQFYKAPKENISENSSTSNTVAKNFGKYITVDELGNGTMGRVLLAYDPDRDTKVALKIMLAGEYAQQEQENRFFVETSAMQRLQHPNIVQIYDVGRYNGINFFTMECIEGTDLETFLKSRKFSSRRCVEIFIKIAKAIQHAHKKQILHRDIKPGNVIMRNDKDPVVTDFGLARFTREGSRLTQTGSLIGTPAYMAPEQARGKTKLIDQQTDIYALGVTLYKMLTQQLPFTAPTPLGTLHKVVNSSPIPVRKINPIIPQDLENICMKAIAKDKKDRFLSVEEMVKDLQRFLDGVSIVTPQSSSSLKKISFWTHQHRYYIVLFTILFVSLIGNIYAVLKSKSLIEHIDILRRNTKIVLPEPLDTKSSILVSAKTSKVDLKIALPPGIVEIHTKNKQFPWDPKITQFGMEIPLKYGENSLKITLFTQSKRYYKLIRKIHRTQQKNLALFLDNTARFSKAKVNKITPLQLQWKFSVENAVITFSPIVLDDCIFFGCRDGFFYCVNDQGELLWKFNSVSPIKGFASISNGIVYFGNESGGIYGLDIYNGQKLFHYDIKQSLRYSPLIIEDTLYANAEKDYFYAIDLKTSQKKWVAPLNGASIYSSPSLCKNGIILSTYDGQVYCLDINNGNTLWKKDLKAKTYSCPIIKGDNIYISLYGKLVVLDAKNGKQKEVCPLEGKISSTGVFYNNKIWITNRSGLIQSVDLKQMKVIDRIDSQQRKTILKIKKNIDNLVRSSPVIAGGEIFINSNQGFYSVNLENEEIVLYHLVDRRSSYNKSSPVIYKDNIYITSADGYLYAYKKKE